MTTSTNTPNSTIIFGIASTEKDAGTIYQTAKDLGQNIFDATVLRLDEEKKYNGAISDLGAAIRKRVRSMYFPEGVRTIIMVTQELAEETRQAVSDMSDMSLVIMD